MKVMYRTAKLVDIVDGFSGVCLADTSQAIVSNLTKQELDRYAKAVLKVANSIALNRKDLTVFDKIDAITFKQNGICLKDSAVTKARIKACKKYRMEFIDRDHLMDHVNSTLPAGAKRYMKQNFSKELEDSFMAELKDFFMAELGNEFAEKILKVVHKLDSQQDLDIEDLQFLSKMELVAASKLDWTIINDELRLAISKSCGKLGIYFQNLQSATLH